MTTPTDLDEKLYDLRIEQVKQVRKQYITYLSSATFITVVIYGIKPLALMTHESMVIIPLISLNVPTELVVQWGPILLLVQFCIFHLHWHRYLQAKEDDDKDAERKNLNTERKTTYPFMLFEAFDHPVRNGGFKVVDKLFAVIGVFLSNILFQGFLFSKISNLNDPQIINISFWVFLISAVLTPLLIVVNWPNSTGNLLALVTKNLYYQLFLDQSSIELRRGHLRNGWLLRLLSLSHTKHSSGQNNDDAQASSSYLESFKFFLSRGYAERLKALSKWKESSNDSKTPLLWRLAINATIDPLAFYSILRLTPQPLIALGCFITLLIPILLLRDQFSLGSEDSIQIKNVFYIVIASLVTCGIVHWLFHASSKDLENARKSGELSLSFSSILLLMALMVAVVFWYQLLTFVAS
jgi:hypothetical protein